MKLPPAPLERLALPPERMPLTSSMGEPVGMGPVHGLANAATTVPEPVICATHKAAPVDY